ncbi:MAG TPA: hypothetical protein VJA21_05870 [Verrucomicrobiae bacterium]
MDLLVRRVSWALLLASSLCLGCHRQSGPPAPLAAENIPAEFEKGFAKAKPQVKELSSKVLSALQTKDYAAAYAAVQELCAAPEAGARQKELAARALLTITGLLQTAQSQGDQKAAEALQIHKMYK